MPSRPPRSPVHTRPRTYAVDWRAVLYLPFRICNPPPAVGKVRSCGVTPLFKVRLDDVLDRKHLPPLGLKDFEEWLLFVEMSPENLYFILWLREYKQRYLQWKSQADFQSKSNPSNLLVVPQHSQHLAMFYSRAKQTFFTPGSAYELNLNSTILGPFHKPDTPHPPPQLFEEAEIEIRRMLDESLRRFAHAQLNNVGNSRVLCGMIAGVVCALVGGVPPLVVNFVLGHTRWERLAALPGFILGLTILISALHGICLGVYIFGDLRQLRKFELSRPPISKPQPLPAYRPPRPTSTTNSILPMQQHPRKSSVPGIPTSMQRSSSRASVRTGMSTSSSSPSDLNIQISPLYFDADEVDPNAMWEDNDSFCFPEEKARDQERQRVSAAPSTSNGFSYDLYTTGGSSSSGSPIDPSFTSTATFIHPFEFAEEPSEDEQSFLEKTTPERTQPLSAFDFDALPLRRSATRRRRGTEEFIETRPAPIAIPRQTVLRSSSPPSPILVSSPTRSRNPSASHFHSSSSPTASPIQSQFSVSPSPAVSILPSGPNNRNVSTAALSAAASSSGMGMGTGTNTGRSIDMGYDMPPPPPRSTDIQYKLTNSRGLPPPPVVPPTSFLARFQEKCNIARWRLQTGYMENADPQADGTPQPLRSSPYWRERGDEERKKKKRSWFGFGRRETEATHQRDARLGDLEKGTFEEVELMRTRPSADDHTEKSSTEDRDHTAKKRFRFINAVPAFRVPLTRILSPVIVRAQWEIVVRSALVACVISWAIIGSLLAIPVRRV